MIQLGANPWQTWRHGTLTGRALQALKAISSIPVSPDTRLYDWLVKTCSAVHFAVIGLQLPTLKWLLELQMEAAGSLAVNGYAPVSSYLAPAIRDLNIYYDPADLSQPHLEPFWQLIAGFD